ncbi:Tetratrico peptide repeat-containing protein [Devosia psychrophila]|uniref:Tetratrico peptide repeat-containing protein n=1 Tax=Devosia psychrophila TaxID=728005 RepID=A0A1I1L7S8_9HYPH|nr:Tetratrico peptide repeat-containing protein [Devosia psychrophila]
MDQHNIPADWLARLATLWTAVDATPPAKFLEAMSTLMAELPEQHSRAPFELASANDSIGNEAAAAPLYQAALGKGLDSDLHRRATIQLASKLRDLGRPDEGLALLIAERQRSSDDLNDAVAIFEALTLADLGLERDALAGVLTRLAARLPRYRRSVTSHAASLPSAPFRDDVLVIFERDGTPPLPTPERADHVEHCGARIWYADVGKGPAVILLHGGLGHSGN